MNNTPTTKPTRKENQSRVTQKQLDRRAKVLPLTVMGNSIIHIANKLKVSPKTIATDIKILTQDGANWADNLALFAWLEQVKLQYTETIQAIKNIVIQQDEIINTNDTSKFQWDSNPYNPHSEADNYHKFQETKRKAYAAFLTKINHYSEYSQLENAKTKAKEFLVTMTTMIPLFTKTQRLAIFYDQNKPKELSAESTDK